jgi:RNA polymerase sigma-70 factor (ECF subfamily)
MPTDEGLEQYREYLHLLGRLQLGSRLQAKIDLSGVVQMTLLEAYRGLDRLRGHDERQKAAWLRQILVNNLGDEFRKLAAGKRDVARERSLDAALAESSARLEAFIAANHTSPSARAAREEDSLRLADALAMLPDGQRRAVELHYLQGRSLAEVAGVLGTSKPAVAGLLHRGLKALRATLEK